MKPKDLQVKRRHHYVWRQYLNQWSLGKSRIYFTTSRRNITHDSAKGVAVADYFYQIKPLDDLQLEMVLKMSQSCSKENHELHMEFLEPILMLQKAKHLYLSTGISVKKIDDRLQALMCNHIEDFHGDVERAMSPILNRLLAEDLDVLNETRERVKFFEYFGHQFARTQNFRNKLTGLVNVKDPTHKMYMQVMDETSWLVTLFYGMNIGMNLFIASSQFHFAMLINDTHTPFITSDQPVVNVHPMMDKDMTAPPEEADFYYRRIQT